MTDIRTLPQPYLNKPIHRKYILVTSILREVYIFVPHYLCILSHTEERSLMAKVKPITIAA